ncbi:hypothetical protein JOQ06_022876 [Pogonophryne albipinna]|uniref:Uncharacterized protein n=1 Tax=Pogonophryne albipinna TaxID=1090488 RepID=A0AAD6A4W8_9TELE|nr:hypothetical protein JOQ06_022876 [Pogonophryne albipinna]
MNASSANVTVVLQYRDPFSKAVAKNLIVVVIGISINYINAGLIHTFCKHQYLLSQSATVSQPVGQDPVSEDGDQGSQAD